MNLNEADLDAFFSADEFADVVTGRPDGKPFRTIYDEGFFDPEAGETVLETTQPRLTCKLSDLTGITRKTTLTVKGQTFTVQKVQPDGTGMAVVLLSHLTHD
jgi:Phage Head-Tail Attachment